MKTDALPTKVRVGALIAAYLSIFLVGYIDGRTSAYIAFSIFYIVPIFVLAWLGNRALGVVGAVTSALCGLAADVWTIGARPIYSYVNLGSRLALFIVVSLVFARLHAVLRDEQQLSEREHILAVKEREIREAQHGLMRSVVDGSRQPLSEIYAKVVDLGFDRTAISAEDLSQLLRDLAEASVKVSRLMDTLELDGSSRAS